MKKQTATQLLAKAPQYLTSHPMWSAKDFLYFRNKGYTNREVQAFWDRDHKAGKSPVSW